jgi:ech hydrogenase subunit A
MAASVYVIAANYDRPATYFDVQSPLVGPLMALAEALMAAYIAWRSLSCKRYLPPALAAMQLAAILYFEFGNHAPAASNAGLFIDDLSLVMTFIIGVIGCLILAYAFGYMGKYHEHHKDVKDRRGEFFLVLFAFLGAMFGLVYANDLLWVYFFWEVTTLASFQLIGYTRSHEALDNAFKALNMNLLGGLAFALAILYLGTMERPALTLQEILLADKAAVLLPVMLIGLAGLTKSAQMPFSSWLVGAMVAPTPVSALLHASTMVKAGVYILVRFAPLLEGTVPGTMLAFVGGVTFLLASAIAISVSNAKKVLAYSTIASLGLITACAGTGTFEAVWAAVLLMLFHALAKSLLFLTVGTVELGIMSRNIEDMEGLITRMPRIAAMMLIGIAGISLAPFGMLISKWATLKAFIDANPVLFGMAAYGSAMTVFFWSKWMGRIIAATRTHKHQEGGICGDEWAALWALAGLTVGVCLFFHSVSHYFVEPYVLQTYGSSPQLGQDNVLIMLLMLTVILVMPFSILYIKADRKHLPPYMCGRTADHESRFSGTAGVQKELILRNYYFEGLFGEIKLLRWGGTLCSILISAMIVLSMPQYVGVLL